VLLRSYRLSFSDGTDDRSRADVFSRRALLDDDGSRGGARLHHWMESA